MLFRRLLRPALGGEVLTDAGAALGTMFAEQQVDSRPPFWWMGLFASPGGLIIVAGIIGIVLLLVVIPLVNRRQR